MNFQVYCFLWGWTRLYITDHTPPLKTPLLDNTGRDPRAACRKNTTPETQAQPSAPRPPLTMTNDRRGGTEPQPSVKENDRLEYLDPAVAVSLRDDLHLLLLHKAEFIRVSGLGGEEEERERKERRKCCHHRRRTLGTMYSVFDDRLEICVCQLGLWLIQSTPSLCVIGLQLSNFELCPWRATTDVFRSRFG